MIKRNTKRFAFQLPGNIFLLCSQRSQLPIHLSGSARKYDALSYLGAQLRMSYCRAAYSEMPEIDVLCLEEFRLKSLRHSLQDQKLRAKTSWRNKMSTTTCDLTQCFFAANASFMHRWRRFDRAVTCYKSSLHIAWSTVSCLGEPARKSNSKNELKYSRDVAEYEQRILTE